MPTETPPPYFPQNPLSPGDEKTARRLRLAFYGCAGFVAVAILCVIFVITYFVFIYFFGPHS